MVPQGKRQCTSGRQHGCLALVIKCTAAGRDEMTHPQSSRVRSMQSSSSASSLSTMVRSTSMVRSTTCTGRLAAGPAGAVAPCLEGVTAALPAAAAAPCLPEPPKVGGEALDSLGAEGVARRRSTILFSSVTSRTPVRRSIHSSGCCGSGVVPRTGLIP